MKKDSLKRTNTRMVHVRLTEELHTRLRIRAAESDTTLQDDEADCCYNPALSGSIMEQARIIMKGACADEVAQSNC